MRRLVAIALSSTVILQAAPLTAAPAIRRPQAPDATGIINGTAQSAAGEVLPKYTVQLRNLQTGQLVGSTTSTSSGGFSFTGLAPANYVVEIVDPTGTIVGSSASIAVTAGTTVTVSATAAATIGEATTGGIGTALLVTTMAAAAGIVGVVISVKNNASPSR